MTPSLHRLGCPICKFLLSLSLSCSSLESCPCHCGCIWSLRIVAVALQRCKSENHREWEFLGHDFHSCPRTQHGTRLLKWVRLNSPAHFFCKLLALGILLSSCVLTSVKEMLQPCSQKFMDMLEKDFLKNIFSSHPRKSTGCILFCLNLLGR